VISYMGAGLPVVCTPSEADRDDREWYDCLRALATDATLRERIGTAGRRLVESRYGVEGIAAEYMALFDRVRALGSTAPRAA
jgi:hypothetical protein